MESNKLMALNNHLFEQMERLNNDDLSIDELKKETVRGKAMIAVAGKIIDNAKLALEAQKFVQEYAEENPELPKMIG